MSISQGTPICITTVPDYLRAYPELHIGLVHSLVCPDHLWIRTIYGGIFAYPRSQVRVITKEEWMKHLLRYGNKGDFT